MSGICFRAVALIIGLLVIPVVGAAEPLSSPRGPAILGIDGLISNKNGYDGASFDLRMLLEFEPTTLSTTSEWTEGRNDFTGVLMRDLMQRVGATGTSIIAEARDGYAVEVPMSDFDRYDVVLVYAMNGDHLSPQDKGHLWIMYPWDAMSDAEVEEKKSNAVWQLNRITVE